MDKVPTCKTYEDSDEAKLGLSRPNLWQMTMMMVMIHTKIQVFYTIQAVVYIPAELKVCKNTALEVPAITPLNITLSIWLGYNFTWDVLI
jgi:hypothetical protein